MFLQLFLNDAKGVDIILQQSGNIDRVGHADLLPHDRGRGGDPRDILKPACSDGFHQSLSIVMILYQMDEGGSNDMRQVADSSGHIIMLLAFHLQRDRSHGGDKPLEFCDFRSGNLRRGSENVVGVFQKARLGIGKADSLAARHRMSADKAVR